MPDRVGVYPGTFDPVTNGHLDIIGRAARLFDRLVIGVATSAAKGPILDFEERLALVRRETASLASASGTVIETQPLHGLLVDFAREHGARTIVRGLRVGSDFDYEYQMAGMNHRLAPGIETVFLMASEHHQFIASSLVRQIAQFGGDIASFVPPTTLHHLRERLRR
jgi:pantetheine-phosphate adenylyltransferase